MDKETELKRNKIMRDYATEMLINATARFCDDVTDAKENGLQPGTVRKLKAHLELMKKTIDLADAAFDDDLLHCILVSLGRKKQTPETDQESNQEKTNQEPQQSEPETDQEEPIQDEPVPEELVQEEQKETQQQ